VAELAPAVKGAVLVYDDDAICAQALASVLRHAGHTVQIATHFRPALAALEAEFRIDILLTDLVVPAGGLNGMALARMGLIKHPGLKVVYMTGYDFDDLEKSANGPILRKPVINETLHFWVQRALSKDYKFWWM
jgi:DNA-binding NtrC family response regulator